MVNLNVTLAQVSKSDATEEDPGIKFNHLKHWRSFVILMTQ